MNNKEKNEKIRKPLAEQLVNTCPDISVEQYLQLINTGQIVKKETK